MDINRYNWSSPHRNERALPQDVQSAIDYMRHNIGQQIGIADLLTVTATPERTLRKRFSKFLGLSPLSFLRQLRLAAARNDLLATSAGSITDIAARVGFTHFGRFSSDYRHCFGELPSATRHRTKLHSRTGDPEMPAIPAPHLSVVPPTLSVMPFRTSGDRESNCLADVIREMLAAELARTRTLLVRLAPATATRGQVARYGLFGRVVCAAGRSRVIVRLINVEEDRHLWGDCFEANASDNPALPDLVVNRVCDELPPRILGQQIDRAQHANLETLTGAEIALRALPLALSSNRGGSANSSADAVELLDQAMTLAPDCGLAVALSGWCHMRSAYLASGTRAAEERAKAGHMADRAGILAAADPMVLAIRASIAHLAKEYEAAESLATRAVAVDPTCAWGWDRLGWVHESTNRPGASLPFFQRAERIPVPYLDGAASLDGVGTAYLTVGRYKEAAALLRVAGLIRPGSTGLHGKLAACYAQLGDKSAASTALAKLRRILPDFTATQYVDGYPCRPGPFKDLLANSLTSIGMPA